MKVFLSWSGDRSKQIAEALRDWLPLILGYAKPWVSRDIPAGVNWERHLAKNLEEARYGILCLTSDNLDAPWILFEAGALSTALDTSAVCPYLLDVDFKEVTRPLSQFQGKTAKKEPTFEMLAAINSRADVPIEQKLLETLFKTFWPQLEKTLKRVFPYEHGEEATRTDEVLNMISKNLRPNLGSSFPEDHDAVLQKLIAALKGAPLNFYPERREVKSKGKSHKADLSSQKSEIGITVRLCNSIRDIRDITEEIVAVAPHFRSRYKSMIFVIYDAGHACDETFLVKDPIRAVHLVVIKH